MNNSPLCPNCECDLWDTLHSFQLEPIGPGEHFVVCPECDRHCKIVMNIAYTYTVY